MALTFTYTGPNSLMENVRLLIGDTDSTDVLLYDEEILYLLSVSANDLYQTARTACDTISAKLSREANKQIGDLRIDLQARAKAYRDMGDRIDLQRNKIVGVYCGGISHSDKALNDQDEDRVDPAFRRGMMKIVEPEVDADE